MVLLCLQHVGASTIYKKETNGVKNSTTLVAESSEGFHTHQPPHINHASTGETMIEELLVVY